MCLYTLLLYYVDTHIVVLFDMYLKTIPMALVIASLVLTVIRSIVVKRFSSIIGFIDIISMIEI